MTKITIRFSGAIIAAIGLYFLYQSYHAIYLSGETVAELRLDPKVSQTQSVTLDPSMDMARAIVSVSYETFRNVRTGNEKFIGWDLKMQNDKGVILWSDTHTHHANQNDKEKKSSSFNASMSQSLADFNIQNSGEYFVSYQLSEYDARYKSASIEIRRNAQSLDMTILAIGVIAFFLGMGILFFQGRKAE